MLEHVPTNLKHAFNLYDRTEKHGITNTCNHAHKVLTVDVNGNCMLCGCDAWLPVSVANILELDSIDAVWHTPTAKLLQQDIDAKKYTWCSVDSCGIKKMNQIKDRYFISINVDEGCNLACPSCRIHKINYTSGSQYESRLRIAKHLVDLINKFDKPCEVMMSGNGDPFASLVYRPLLLNMEPKDNIHIRMLTNALMLKKVMPKTKIKDSIRYLDISIDAGDKATYERLRLGGRWEVLLENLDYVKQEFNCEVTLKFVLQRDNVDSVENFVELVERYGFRGNIMPLEDWGTMKNFSDHSVMNPENPMNAKANKLLDKFRDNKSLFFHSI